MEESKITISKFEYDDLKETKVKYKILMNHIFYSDKTSLSFDKEDLVLSANSILNMIKGIEPVWYKQVINNYNKKEENNNDTNR